MQSRFYCDREPAVEWSDGRAPDLEPVIRGHCVPFVAGGNSIGLAVTLVTPTNATIMTFGRPSLSTRAQTRADTLFEIGSLTKTFTGLTLARQIERGSVRLDQPVQELLPPGVELPAAAQGITLRHLTSHSSGFPRLLPGWSLRQGAWMLLFGSDPYAGYNVAKLRANMRSARLISKPGAEVHYSNFGMMLLGYLLATKAGASYEAFVKQEVCVPLAMNDTTITLDPGRAARTAQGYRTVLRCGCLAIALRSAPWFERTDLGGAGALRSTATDMLKYLLANMRPVGWPLEHALRESHKVVFKTPGRAALGMNWMRAQNRRLKQPLIWHNGATGGYRSYIGFTGDGRFGVVVLSNGTENVDGLAMAMLRDLAAPAPDNERPLDH